MTTQTIYRRFIVQRWDDLDGLPAATRLLYQYMCTGPDSTRLGLLRIAPRRLAAGADLDRQEVTDGLGELAGRDLVAVGEARGANVIYLVGHIRDLGQRCSPKELLSWRRELEALPPSHPRDVALAELAELDGGKRGASAPDTPSVPDPCPTDTPSAPQPTPAPASDTPSVPHGSPTNTPSIPYRYPIDGVPVPDPNPIDAGHGQGHGQGQRQERERGARAAPTPSRKGPRQSDVSRNPPSLEGVSKIMAIHARRKGWVIKADELAEQFIDYYASNGWRVGNKGAMKDWSAAARRWVTRSQEGGPGQRRSGRAAAATANARAVAEANAAPAGVHRVER